MQREPISIQDFTCSPLDIWDRGWFLLSSGDFAAGDYNSMTVSYGSFGTMWNKPFAMVVVRPQRYTWQFLEKFDSFTLCAFPSECRKALEVLGAKSGRQIDKIHPAGLTPIAASMVASPAYDQAHLIVECRKIYFNDFDPRHFLADYIAPGYNNDYHRMYFGEILAVSGTERYTGRKS